MKVGDYVRTEYGIDKIIGYRYEPEYENGHVLWFEKSDSGCRCTDKDLPKSSPNIIDLIEVGDYVNGHRVNYVNKNREHFNISFGDEDFNLKSKFNSDIYWLSKEDIKSIVTKEAFESMKYTVGG